TPGTLDSCHEPDDLLRREIEHAVALGRNVVPILVNDFHFDDTVRAHLPESLRDLPRYNGLELPRVYFDAAMERLRTRFLKEPAQGFITPVYFDAAMERLRTRFLREPVQGVIVPAPPQDAPVVQRKIAEAERQAAQDVAPRLTNSIGMEFVLIPS